MSIPLKAWVVSNGEWSELFHAETKGKARWAVAQTFFTGYDAREEFLCLTATRFPSADGRSFTFCDRLRANGWDAIVDDIDEVNDTYVSECDCIHCKPEVKHE